MQPGKSQAFMAALMWEGSAKKCTAGEAWPLAPDKEDSTHFHTQSQNSGTEYEGESNQVMKALSKNPCPHFIRQ